MKKTLLLILLISLGACSSIKEKSSGLKPNIGTCPPMDERTLGDILCKEPK